MVKKLAPQAQSRTMWLEIGVKLLLLLRILLVFNQFINIKSQKYY